jgi:hypothetical protein
LGAIQALRHAKGRLVQNCAKARNAANTMIVSLYNKSPVYKKSPGAKLSGAKTPVAKSLGTKSPGAKLSGAKSPGVKFLGYPVPPP